MRTRLLLFIAFIVTSVFGNTQTITIGKQVWSTKNLDVSTFRNGDSIPEAKSIEEWNAYTQAEEPAWCYYENDVSNGIKYGKLYNFYAVADNRGLAPNGFHIPSDKEWKKLSDYLGGEDKAGAKMKSKEGWDENGNGTNSSGFSALPGGFINNSGFYDYIGFATFWWSATEVNSSCAWAFSIGIKDAGRTPHSTKHMGISIRSIKN